MTRNRAATLAFVGILTAVVLIGGSTGTFGKLFGPSVMLDASGQLRQHGGAPAMSGGQPAAAPALQSSGVASAAARAFTAVSVAPARREANGYAIEARLVGKDGKGLVDIEIAFYDVLALLGPREMLIGTAKTDGFGTASIEYLPAQGGTHTVNVRPLQWDRLGATQATVTIEAARVAPATYARERLPLDPFSSRLPSIGAVVVLAIWALFAFIVLGSAYLIPRGAKRSHYMGKAKEV